MEDVPAPAQFCPLCGLPTQGGFCPTHGVAGRSGPSLDPSQVFVPGAMLGGRFRVDAVLAVYGPHATLLATETNGRPVVIETLGVERLARRARLLDGLFREAGIPRLFNRPDLIEIVDFGVEPITQNPFLVLAYTPGRSAPEIVAPGSIEKHTAGAFVEVCHGLLDQHDGEFLNDVDAMPTAVPGSLPTQVPGVSQPVGLVPQLQRAARAPSPPPAADEQEDEPAPVGSKGGWKWVLLACLVGLGIYWIAPNPAANARYYNPNITRPMTLYNSGEARADPRQIASMGGGGTIEIDSSPAGAEIWSGRLLIGETPMTVPKPSGGDRLRFILKKPGFLDKAVVVHRDSDDVDVELHAQGGGNDSREAIVGRRDKRKGLLDGNPFDPEDGKGRFGEDPRAKSPFLQPFGTPGTAPSLEDDDTSDMDDADYNPYDDDL